PIPWPTGDERDGGRRSTGPRIGRWVREEFPEDPLYPYAKRGLIWLARAQEPDGSWDAKRWDGAQPYRVGSTGLALLAFLGAGYTHRRGPFKETVRRGLGWLAARQRPDGSFPWQTFYEQGIATMAVSEAYQMTRYPTLGRVAQRAADYIFAVQPDHGGFRYTGPVARGEGDMSVTGWQIMALKSARSAGLRVPQTAFDRSHTFLAGAWRGYGASAYLVSKQGKGSLAVSAIGMACRIFLDPDRYEEEIRETAQLLLDADLTDGKAVPGGASKQLVRDLYYTYYSSLAMFQYGSGGEAWRVWDSMFRAPLANEQIQTVRDARGRHIRGSWDPASHRWGKAGGRVYTTAMALLSIEVPYRFLPIYKR
ncbi:prenyltransferase/squalene oxidase repeat-containing protein, partial [Planctomycetota bacterium]